MKERIPLSFQVSSSVHPIRRDGKIVGYQYGDTGKVYPVSDGGKAGAAKKAGEQGAAIEHSEDNKK